jgi:hypothetical protein
MEKAIEHKNFYIFTYCTDESQLIYLKKTANLFNLKINYILSPQSEWKCFSGKILKMKQILDTMEDESLICFIDAYDVLVNASADEILEKFLSYNSNLVISAELNSYPGGFQHLYDHSKAKTNFKFLNSGGYCGYKKSLMKIFNWKTDEEIIEICKNCGDQHYFVRYYLEHYDEMVLDTNCLLFQCMFQTDWNEFKFIEGRCKNVALDTKPCFIHFNGESWKLNIHKDPYANYSYLNSKEVFFTQQNVMQVFIEKMDSSSISNTVLDLHDYQRHTWQDGGIVVKSK